MLTAGLIALVGVLLAIFLARLLLGGFLDVAFRRVRSFIRRVLVRRTGERPGSDRRHDERRS